MKIACLQFNPIQENTYVVWDDTKACIVIDAGNSNPREDAALDNFIAGHSAGGYLTSMIGLDKRWMAPYGIDPDTAFAALIPYSGQVVTHFARRREMGIPDTQVVVDDMAPLNYIRPDCPPILILSGDRGREMLGRYEENAYFWRMMQVVGHPDVEIREFDGFDHGNMPQAGHYVAVRYIRDFVKKLER